MMLQFIVISAHINNFISQGTLGSVQTEIVCQQSKIILGVVNMYCVKGNQSNKYANNSIQFNSDQQFNASIFFDAQRLDRLVFISVIAESVEMHTFSLVISERQLITSSSINVSYLDCYSTSFISRRGSIALNHSTISFRYTGINFEGILSFSTRMILLDVVFDTYIYATYGVLFAKQAVLNININEVNITGIFAFSNGSCLINIGSNVNLTIQNAFTNFFVKQICNSGSYNMTGVMVVGLNPVYYNTKTIEQGIKQILFDNYNIKQIVLNGVNIEAGCIIDGVQDFNFSFVYVDEDKSNMNTSLFCYRPMFNNMIIQGSFKTNSAELSSSASIFVTPNKTMILQNTEISVNFVSSNTVILSIIADYSVNQIIVRDSNISIIAQSNDYAYFYGISKNVYNVTILNCNITFSASNLKCFYGVALQLIDSIIDSLIIDINVNIQQEACGLGQNASGVFVQQLTISGQLTGINTFGLFKLTSTNISLTNINFFLKTYGTISNCGFIQIISQDCFVETNNIQQFFSLSYSFFIWGIFTMSMYQQL
ncbi:Hypothetical_protein [Hexamita inflata]|uniref:Hypothetical_protein n=1 Tax=Hexamita inflata TaxID=28002 RepID=A0AA86TGB7_9EUKA|nr:Hypothetical protein HINF_LOCUS123 [Hexamita inflata]